MDFNKTIKITRKVLIWISGIFLGLLLILQIILLPPIFTPIVNSLASDFVNADIYVGRASGSIFSHFPKISFELNDIEITYPHERYDSLARAGAQHELLYRGCGEAVDTLALIKSASASISLHSLLWGEIRIPDIELESPAIYAHSYDAANANWNIFGSADITESTDTTENEVTVTAYDGEDDDMRIILNRIHVTGNPKIVYTDSQDSLFVHINLESAGFDGNFEPDALHRTMANASVNKMQIDCRYGTELLAGDIQHITLSPCGDRMHLDILALGYSEYEEDKMLSLPIMFQGDLAIPESDGIAVSLHNIQSSIGSVPSEGYIDIAIQGDSTIVDGQLDIIGHNIQQLLNMYISYLDKDMKKVKTDTEVSVHATVNGIYGGSEGTMPEVNVDITIPDSGIDNESFPDKINLGLVANAHMDKTGQISAEIFRAMLKTYGLEMNSCMNTVPCGEDDREVYIDGKMRVSLDSLRAFLPDTLNLTANGGFSLKMNGSTKLSDLDLYQFSNSGLEGKLYSKNITFSMQEDTVSMNLADMDITLMPEFFTSRKDPAIQKRLMGINGSLGSAEIKYKDAVTFTGESLNITAKNSADQTDGPSDDIKFVSGKLNAKNMFLEDSEGTSIKLENTENTFRIRPDFNNPTVPVLSLSNKNLRITYITPDNRAILTDSKIKGKATMNRVNREAKREAALDSLATVYPDIPRDSLFRHARSQKKNKATESWMTEEEFRQSDLKFDINESAKKYFREWDLEGEVGIRTGIIMTPQFPLRNIIRGIHFSFTNDKASIDSLKINAGESQLCAKGYVSNLKRAILGRGTFKLGLDITSESVNADELFNAYAIGSQYQPKAEEEEESTEELSNAEFFKQVTSDTVKIDRPTSSLVVIPGNLNAEIGIGMSGIKYQDLDISKMNSHIILKERCAQITGTTFESNVGNAYLDAFYTVRNKKDIKTGFCLDLKDVTSKRVISLMPQISSVMPMIGSINGNLNCEVAVTAELDTTMSIKMSTVNGIARLSGKNLVISDDPTYRAIAKKLMFKNKRKGEIKDLMVEGTIKDKRLQIYPFLLSLDRYRLAVTGIQNADMSYMHHISVLRSPLLIRLGLNLRGPDYDNMSFNIGRAQYRSRKMPSFTAVIDQTKIDLKHSIYNIFETGVDETIENRNTLGLIELHHSQTGYVNVAELELEQLSDEDMKKFSEMESTEDVLNELTVSVINAVLEVLSNN